MATGLVANAQQTSTVLAAPTKKANVHGAAFSTSPILRKCLSFGRKQALWQSADELTRVSRSTFIYRNLDEHLCKRMSLTRQPKVRESYRLGFGAKSTQAALALNGVVVLGEREGLKSDVVAFVTGRSVLVSWRSQETFPALLEHPPQQCRELISEEPYALQPAQWMRMQEHCGALIELSLNFSVAREDRCCRGEHSHLTVCRETCSNGRA